MKWLDSNVKIEKVDEYTITISKNISSLKLNESKTNATFSYQNMILYEYVVRSLDPKHLDQDLLIEVFEPKTIEQVIKDEEEEISIEIYQNIENLAISMLKYCDRKYQFTNAERRHNEDITSLAKDSRFMQVLASAEEKYNKYFSTFKELSRRK